MAKNRRKPLPYAASMAVDAALMANQDAMRSLMILVREPQVTAEETMRRLAEAVHRIHESNDHLREAKSTELVWSALQPAAEPGAQHAHAAAKAVMTKYTVKMQIRYVPLPPEKEASYRAALRLLWKLLSSSPNPSPDSRTPDAATLSEHDPASEPGDGVPPALSLGNNGGASREVSPAGQGEGLTTEETPLRERYAAEIHEEILNSAEAI